MWFDCFVVHNNKHRKPKHTNQLSSKFACRNVIVLISMRKKNECLSNDEIGREKKKKTEQQTALENGTRFGQNVKKP